MINAPASISAFLTVIKVFIKPKIYERVLIKLSLKVKIKIFAFFFRFQFIKMIAL